MGKLVVVTYVPHSVICLEIKKPFCLKLVKILTIFLFHINTQIIVLFRQSFINQIPYIRLLHPCK